MVALQAAGADDAARLSGHWQCASPSCAGAHLEFRLVAGTARFAGTPGAGPAVPDGSTWTVGEHRLQVVTPGGRRLDWVLVRLDADELVLLDEFTAALQTYRRQAR